MLVIWDLDGTLVDSRADLAASGNDARAALGLPPLAESVIAGFVGDGLGVLIQRLIPEGDPTVWAAARKAFELSYADRCTQRPVVYPGIITVLERCAAAGWTQGVATNKAIAFTTPILRVAGLAQYFAAVVGGDGPRKPDPGQLQQIAAMTGADLTTGWMVGDHHTDLLAGKAAGCKTVFCTWGMGRRDGHPAHAVAQRPEDLPGCLGLP